MKRRLFNLMAGLSLLMCVATAVLWVRSHWVWDMPVLTALRLQGNDGRWVGLEFSSVNGGLGLFVKVHHFGSEFFDVYRQQLNGDEGPRWMWTTIESLPGCTPHDWPSHLGFKLDPIETHTTGDNHTTYYERRRQYGVVVPDWSLVAIFAATPLCWIVKRRRGRREGLCPKCGYDLRASSGRCPECGTAIVAQSEARSA
jgi:hypothetical protein